MKNLKLSENTGIQLPAKNLLMIVAGAVVATIAITAIAQVLVQLVFFLHMNSSSEQRWNVIAFIYTILTIAVLLIGSVWIMNYLHSNMML